MYGDRKQISGSLGLALGMEMNCKSAQKSFRGDGNILKLDCSGG